MISGDNKSGDEGDLKDVDVDDHFAKLISKKKIKKVNNSSEISLSLCS